MTDFDYDAYQKKQIAHSAQRRVRNKKGCRLPSDYMTKAQRNKLNGGVKSVNLNSPMTWAEFKQLPKTLQEDYINHIITEYKVGIKTISNHMFHIADTSFHYHKRQNSLSIVNSSKKTSKSALERFINQYCKPEPAESVEPMEAVSESENTEQDADPVAVESPAEVEEIPGANVSSYSFRFDHVTDWTDILKLVGNMPLPNNAAVTVMVAEGSTE